MNMNEVVEKPWGKEEILEQNNFYVLKRLTMNKGHQCSLQYHDFKHETIYVHLVESFLYPPRDII